MLITIGELNHSIYQKPATLLLSTLHYLSHTSVSKIDPRDTRYDLVLLSANVSSSYGDALQPRELRRGAIKYFKALKGILKN